MGKGVKKRELFWPFILLISLGSCSRFAFESREQLALKKLRSDDAAERSKAAIELGRGAFSSTVVQSLVDALHDEDKSVRQSACHSLGDFGTEAKDAVSALGEVLLGEHECEDVQLCALDALSNISSDNGCAVPALEKALKIKRMVIRTRAATALGRIGTPAFGAKDSLIRALDDSESEVRISAARALNEIVPGNLLTIEALSKELANKDGPVRSFAALLLGNIGENAWPAAPALRTALSDPSADVRSSAAQALGQIGFKARSAILSLLDCARKDKDGLVRQIARQSLGKTAFPFEITCLEEFLDGIEDKGPPERINAIHSFARWGPHPDFAIPALERVLNDSDASVRSTAIEALGNFGEEAMRSAHALRDALKDQNETVRKTAANALKKIEK
jgi:HEAT repeat protein